MHKLSELINKIKKYLAYGNKEKLLIIKAFLITGICNLIINRIPIKKYNKMLGEKGGESDMIISREAELKAEKIGDIINMVSKHTPWNSRCFVKAMTAQILLKQYKIGSTLYMGVRKKNSQMTAHAWVRSGRVSVVGGDGNGYTVVQKFKKINC